MGEEIPLDHVLASARVVHCGQYTANGWVSKLTSPISTCARGAVIFVTNGTGLSLPARSPAEGYSPNICVQ